MNQKTEDDGEETGGDDYLPHEGQPVRPFGLTQIDRNADFWGLVVCVGIAVLLLLGFAFVGRLMWLTAEWASK